MQSLKRSSRWIGVSLLAALLLFIAGGLAADAAKGDWFGHSLQPDTGAPADTVCGGGNNPGSDKGDPDDVDVNHPFLLWVVTWLIRF